MEVILAFFAGWLFTWPALLALAIVGILFEANDGHKMAAFIGVVAAVVAYFYFGLAPLQAVYYGVGYVLIGFVWSFWRYKRHCDKMVNKHKDESIDFRKRIVEQLRPTNMLSTITMWVLVWPFSVVENLVGDLISALQTMITRFFRGVYNRIFDGASAELLRDAK